MGKIIEESIKKQTLTNRAVYLEFIWMESLSRVDEYHEESGLWPSVHNPDANIARLGSWCTAQRGKLKRGILDTERKDKLDSINFEWSPEPGKWSETFEKVKEYHDRTNQWPSVKDKDTAIAYLGRWCFNQRSGVKNKRACLVTPERKELLDSINFAWGVFADRWSEAFEKVKEYHDKTGRWPSDKDKDIDISRLGAWCDAQRSTLSGKRNYEMNSDRKEMLDSIGFMWKKNNPKNNRDDLMRALNNKTIELGRELKRNDIDTDLSLPSYLTVLKITGLKFKELKKQIKQ